MTDTTTCGSIKRAVSELLMDLNLPLPESLKACRSSEVMDVLGKVSLPPLPEAPKRDSQKDNKRER